MEAVIVEAKFTKRSDVGGVCCKLFEFSKVFLGGSGFFSELFCGTWMKTNGSVDVASCGDNSVSREPDGGGKEEGKRTDGIFRRARLLVVNVPDHFR